MSTRIGVREKESLINEFQLLFGRCYEMVKCPIPPGHHPALYNRILPAPLHAVATEMMGRGYDCSAWFRDSAILEVLHPNGVAYQIHLGPTYMIRPLSVDHAKFMFDSQYMRRPAGDAVTTSLLQEAYGGAFDELMAWAANYEQLVAECTAAWRACEEIIMMVNTAGQVRRMVPDMIQYLSQEKRDALSNQPRSSAVPYEWAAYDRNKVYAMLNTMAKCWMMPGEPAARIIFNEPQFWAKRTPQ